MAQKIKALAAKPDDQSSILGTPLVRDNLVRACIQTQI